MLVINTPIQQLPILQAACKEILLSYAQSYTQEMWKTPAKPDTAQLLLLFSRNQRKDIPDKWSLKNKQDSHPWTSMYR